MDTETRLKKIEDFLFTQNNDFQNAVYQAVQEALDRNGGLGIGGKYQPSSSALFNVDSQRQGVVFPRMTTAVRDAIVAPLTGLLIYNTTTNVYNFYNGTSWLAI